MSIKCFIRFIFQLERGLQEVQDNLSAGEKKITELEKEIAVKNDEFATQETKLQHSDDLCTKLQSDFDSVRIPVFVKKAFPKKLLF